VFSKEEGRRKAVLCSEFRNCADIFEQKKKKKKRKERERGNQEGKEEGPCCPITTSVGRKKRKKKKKNPEGERKGNMPSVYPFSLSLLSCAQKRGKGKGGEKNNHRGEGKKARSVISSPISAIGREGGGEERRKGKGEIKTRIESREELAIFNHQSTPSVACRGRGGEKKKGGEKWERWTFVLGRGKEGRAEEKRDFGPAHLSFSFLVSLPNMCQKKGEEKKKGVGKRGKRGKKKILLKNQKQGPVLATGPLEFVGGRGGGRGRGRRDAGRGLSLEEERGVSEGLRVSVDVLHLRYLARQTVPARRKKKREIPEEGEKTSGNGGEGGLVFGKRRYHIVSLSGRGPGGGEREKGKRRGKKRGGGKKSSKREKEKGEIEKTQLRIRKEIYTLSSYNITLRVPTRKKGGGEKGKREREPQGKEREGGKGGRASQ